MSRPLPVLLLAAASALRHDPNAARRRTLHLADELEAAARELPRPARETAPTPDTPMEAPE